MFTYYQWYNVTLSHKSIYKYPYNFNSFRIYKKKKKEKKNIEKNS